MTRKRHVKLIMAKGKDRRFANKMADRIPNSGLSYKSAYLSYNFDMNDLSNALTKLSTSTFNVIKALNNLSKKLHEEKEDENETY